MRRKSDAHGTSSSARTSSYSIDDESFASYFEDKLFFSALYEFSQGLGPIQIWEYYNSNENLMRFVVNTPTPDIISSSAINNGERVTNIISKFEDLYYIALYSQVLDCQARGFTRSIVLVIANQSPEIIKYVHESYIDEFTKIINRIYENSYKLFLDEIQGYSISLLKTAEATNSLQLQSKFKELKTYLPNFGIDIEKIINDEGKQKQQQLSLSNLTKPSISLSSTYGEVKDESFFTKIDNNLRSIRTITDFDYSIVEDLQDLITNLPKTETIAAISAHIDLNSFHNLKMNTKKNNDLKTSSDDSLQRTSFHIIANPIEPYSVSSNTLLDKVRPSNLNNEKINFESFTDTSISSLLSESSDLLDTKKDDNKKITISTKSDIKSKTSRHQTTKDKDSSKKRPESVWNRKQRKKQLQLQCQQNRIYGFDYPYDFNFGGFKGKYSRLVTAILNTNYDASLFTLQWLVRFKVFQYCAFTILSGGTLVIVTSAQDTEHGKMLADRFSLLAPHSLIRGRSRTRKRGPTKSGDLIIENLGTRKSSSDSDDSDDDDFFEEDSQIVLVKESVEPRECFRFSIVVTNSLKQPTPSISFCSSEKVQSSFPIVTTFSRANEKDEALLSVLDLTTNIYKGDGCPDSSFVMKELGTDTSLISSATSNNGGNISSFSSISQVDQIQQSQTQANIELSKQTGIASSSSNFSPIFRRRQKPAFKQTANSPPSPLSISSGADTNNDQFSPIHSSRDNAHARTQDQTQLKPKLAALRNYSSSIITMSGSNSNTSLSGNQNNDDNQKTLKTPEKQPNTALAIDKIDTENESEFSISELESDFSSLSTRRIGGFGIGTYSGLNKHNKRPFRPSFLSDASTISSSASTAAIESSESENLFVLNMYATINRVAARFVKKLAEFKKNENPPSKEELMKEIGFNADDEPILKYWIYCFFNKQKCRPVLFNNRSNVGITVISMYK